MLGKMVDLVGRRVRYTHKDDAGAAIGTKIGKAIIGTAYRTFDSSVASDTVDLIFKTSFFVDIYPGSHARGFPMPYAGDVVELLNDADQTRVVYVVTTGDNDIEFRPADAESTAIRVHCKVGGYDLNAR